MKTLGFRVTDFSVDTKINGARLSFAILHFRITISVEEKCRDGCTHEWHNIREQK